MVKAGSKLAAKTRITLAGLSYLFTNVRGVFLTLDGSRKVRAGLQMDGSSDLIGFTKIMISPDMVGRQVAIFTALEVKAGRDSLKPDQRNFLSTVRDYGGIAAVIRDKTDCEKIIKDYIDNRHTLPL